MPREKDKMEKGDGFLEDSPTTLHLKRDEATQHTSVLHTARWMSKSEGWQEEKLTRGTPLYHPHSLTLLPTCPRVTDSPCNSLWYFHSLC